MDFFAKKPICFSLFCVSFLLSGFSENGVITINNGNYYCELNYDQFGNIIPIIPMQNENGNVFYQSVVFDVESCQFVLVPYDGINYVTVPVIQNNSNDGSYFN